MNAISRHPQAFRYTVRHLTFTNKGVGADGESGLLAGVQLADENYDDGVWAGCPQLSQGIARGQGN